MLKSVKAVHCTCEGLTMAMETHAPEHRSQHQLRENGSLGEFITCRPREGSWHWDREPAHNLCNTHAWTMFEKSHKSSLTLVESGES